MAITAALRPGRGATATFTRPISTPTKRLTNPIHSPQPPNPASPTSTTPASRATPPNPQAQAPSQSQNPYPACNPDLRRSA